MKKQSDWWRGAVLYQIYPRSFYDSNGDGIGDLEGIRQKLDYIKSLGVDGIWISPFFKSPMKDFGYDVSDYCQVDALFGTLDDFDRLLTEAHQRGLKVMIDFVLSHTSDQHLWFQESRQNKINAKADWYVWADPKPDGTPPNNWLSIFGGTAWAWEPRRGQYYLHNFLTSQPDLNYHNPEVLQAVLKDMRFWLERGVDGFRLDAVNFSTHDAKLRDNPALPKENRIGVALKDTNPYAYQSHVYDKSQPENLKLLQAIRKLLDEFPGTTSIGEVGDDDSMVTAALYTKGNDLLHMAYTFELLGETFSASYLATILQKSAQLMQEGWPCWSFGNHDVPRVVSRWGQHDADQQPYLARLVLVLLASMRGSIILYQGEELGLPEAEIAYDDIQDPYGLTFYPDFKGRDGCRTPFPWSSQGRYAGFSGTKPWLPIPDQHYGQAADQQDREPQSILNFYRDFLGWRRQQQALIQGTMHVLPVQGPILAFVRTHDQQKNLCVFNCGTASAIWDIPSDFVGSVPQKYGRAQHIGHKIILDSYGYMVL